MNQKGKITFLSFIAIFIIVYGGFVAIKLLGAGFADKQIEQEVIESLGATRGSHFTAEMGEELIRKILQKKNVIFDKDDEDVVNVNLNHKKGTIEFYYRYEVEVDLILFKKRRVVEVRNEVSAYA
ncbi:MAG: hypothetical protein KAT17_06685 [Candidatus Aminicenantes bacterium]|nr:hypothetical protein [Candidatus Aminicenantes bacterium]